jgi:hypothetical protein
MPPYTTFMLIFSAALLLYAGVTAVTKDVKMIPWRYRDKAKMKDKKLYMTQFAKILALVALVPGISGIVGIWTMVGAMIVFVAGLVITLWIGTKLIDKVN